MLFSNCRATNLVPMLLAMCCWAATTLAANANEQSFKSLCGLGALDVPGFTSAQPAFVPPPSYPSEAEDNWSEGWAMLEYAISSDGAVRGITVVDALGQSDFIASTVKAVESWRYKPATRNGLAVEQSLYQLSVLFRLRGPRREANHEQFIRQYNRSRLLLQGKRYDEAIAIMEDAFKARLNLYETTMGSFMLAIAYAQKGDWQRALFHIRHAVIEDGAYLEKSLRVIAFASQVELEVRQGNLAEAKCAFHQLRTIDSPSALGESKAAKMIATIDATLSNPKPLVTSATLATHPLLESAAVWRHQMFRPKFSFAEINGEVKSFRLACAGGSQEASVNLKTQWNVPSQSGRCLLRVEGETGATFRLIEEH